MLAFTVVLGWVSAQLLIGAVALGTAILHERHAAARVVSWGVSGVNDTLTTSPAAVGPDADGKYSISAPGIRILFVPYGASVSNLFIQDDKGVERDIVVGFDNASYYTQDASHPHLGSVPGRYANRIKNSSFVIDDRRYHVTPNENNGADTLHGGPDGWDYRNFTVVEHTTDSITFSIVDPDGKEGFPGEVVSYIEYRVTEMAWHIKMTALATTKKTPIMLTSHTYWNLDGFQNPETPTALKHSLYLPKSMRRVGVDSFLIPTGAILDNQKGSVNDFWSSAKQVGRDLPQAQGNCGPSCTGYDNCFIIEQPMLGSDEWVAKGPVATLSSKFSGITLDIFSDQQAVQMYSCNWQDGTLALKKTQGFSDDPSRPRVVKQYGCVVLEVQDWIDGINHPEWWRSKRQIFGPKDDPFVLRALYNFTIA